MDYVVLYIFVGLYILAAAVKPALSAVNLFHIRKRGDRVPGGLSDFIDQEGLRRSIKYSHANAHLADVQYIFHKVLVLIFILSGLFGWYAGIWSGFGPVTAGLLFFGGLFIASFILNIPFSYYAKFVKEEKYGFNVSTIRTWITDLTKGLVISGVISGILLLGLLLLLKYIPGYWWLVAWMAAFLFSLFLIFIYPIAIAPIFNKFIPVEGTLAEKLIGMAGKGGINVTGVYRMDESKRSRHTNAYFTGIGNSKRIVLYDTLTEKHPEDEIVAILAHEVGHWKKKHVIKLFLISQAASFLGLIIAAWAIREPLLYTSFGLSVGQVYAGLFILMVFFEILSLFFSPVSSAFARRFEREADRCAVQLIPDRKDMLTALKRLTRDNLSTLQPHPLYVSFFYSHPPILERIRFIEGQ